jgi:tripartite-type tricarboxylate transporter receptor subunit TctC
LAKSDQDLRNIFYRFPPNELEIEENAMLLTRRRAMAASAGGLTSLLGSAAWSQQAYPSRTIKMIVPYPAGGTTDLLGRMVADQLKSGLNATCIVENKPGAGTVLGAEQVARSEPDGYTLLMATSTTLAINKTLYKKLPYDPVKDFTPIALLAGVPFALIINPMLPIKTLTEFIAYAKSKPGELAYGSAGNGSPQHLGAEMLRTAAGIDIRHVPYRGSVPAMLDIIAGHIPFMIVDLQPALQQIREGKVRCSASPRQSGSPRRRIFRRWQSPGCPASSWWRGRAWLRPPAFRVRSSTNWQHKLQSWWPIPRRATD